MSYIDVEFRAGTPSNWAFLDRMRLPAIPDVGELVNMRGAPYVVQIRQWAYEVVQTDQGCRDQTFCYIYLI